MTANVTFNLDDVNAMQAQAESLRHKAKLLVEQGKHEEAADCIELAGCADNIRKMVIRMTQLLSKCPCCYKQPTIN